MLKIVTLLTVSVFLASCGGGVDEEIANENPVSVSGKEETNSNDAVVDNSISPKGSVDIGNNSSVDPTRMDEIIDPEENPKDLTLSPSSLITIKQNIDPITTIDFIESTHFVEAIKYNEPISSNCSEMTAQVNSIKRELPNGKVICSITDLRHGESYKYKVRVDKTANYRFNIVGNDNVEEQPAKAFLVKVNNEKEPYRAASQSEWQTHQASRLEEGVHTIEIKPLSSNLLFSGFEMEPLAFDNTEVDLSQLSEASQFSIVSSSEYGITTLSENIFSGETLVYDVDELGSSKLNVLAHGTSGTQTVGFYSHSKPLISRQFLEAGSQGSNDFESQPMKPGNTYSLKIYSSDNLDDLPRSIIGFKDPTLKIKLLKQEARIEDRDYILISDIGGSSSTDIEIKNTGNSDVNFTLESPAAWLNLEEKEGMLLAGETKSVEISSDKCSAQLEDSQPLYFKYAGNQSISLDVHYRCTQNESLDTHVDRVYFSQGVIAFDSKRSADDQIPLIENRDGLLRVFVSASSHIKSPPAATLHYVTSAGEKKSIKLLEPDHLSSHPRESELAFTYNVQLKKDFFRVGTQFYVEVEPLPNEETTQSNRFPKSGYQELNIIQLPEIKFTFVRIEIESTAKYPNFPQEFLDVGSFKQEDLAVFMDKIYALWPIGDYKASIRSEKFTINALNTNDALNQLKELYREEGDGSYYIGIINPRDSLFGGASGQAELNQKFMVGFKRINTILHEFGHALTLEHADCLTNQTSEAGGDYGMTLDWGYNIVTQELHPPEFADIMGYCDPSWVTRQNYKTAMEALILQNQ